MPSDTLFFLRLKVNKSCFKAINLCVLAFKIVRIINYTASNIIVVCNFSSVFKMTIMSDTFFSLFAGVKIKDVKM